MKLLGRSKGAPTVLKSADFTFCAVDAHPSELFWESTNSDESISYTGVVVPQPEYFLDIVQWKATDNFEHRLDLLRKIKNLVQKENSRDVLCVSVTTIKKNGWDVGKMIIDDAIGNSSKMDKLTGKKKGFYSFGGKYFKETHAVSMALYSCAITTLFQIFAREISKAKSLMTLRKPSLQFLLDTISGDPALGQGERWNLNLVLFLIENTPLLSILLGGMKKSCFKRYGIDTPRTSRIVGEVVENTNDIPIMLAVDWFAKICNRHQELKTYKGDIDEDDSIITEIVEALIDKKCLLFQPLWSPESGGVGSN